MKKSLCLCLLGIMLFSLDGALANTPTLKPNKYSLPEKGTVLQDQEDRRIAPQTEAVRHPLIPGESPTTGQPWDGDYQPMLVVVSNPLGSTRYNKKTVKAAGIGQAAPYGVQYADIMYEDIISQKGQTRMTFLFSDSFAQGQPVSVGPVRSARPAQALLRQEWQAGLVFSGSARRPGSDIYAMLNGQGAEGLVFDLRNEKAREAMFRVLGKGRKAPDTLNVNPVALRGLIPAEYVSQPRAFLFADEGPDESYITAGAIHLDWGDKNYISHFYYDEATRLYARFSGNAPYKTFSDVDDQSQEDQIPMTFSNVIIQRVSYEYPDQSALLPVLQAVGQGNADIFIGGRYIPGYWMRASENDPTIYYDDQGQEVLLLRGKTYIAQFPPESRCTFTAE